MPAKKEKKKPIPNRIYHERIAFWIGPIHLDLLERASETLGINRSVLARRIFYFLRMPKEELIKYFGKDVDGFEYPPKTV